MLGNKIDADTIVVHPSERGRLKQALLKLGWPAEALAGYVDGEAHAISLRQEGWTLRSYQSQAVGHFSAGGTGRVLPHRWDPNRLPGAPLDAHGGRAAQEPGPHPF